MKRNDIIREIARREALGAAWNDSARGLRAELAAQATAEFEANGNGVTWTVKDLGRVCLPTTDEAVIVADVEPLKRWVKQHHPDELQIVVEVRPAFQTWLLKHATITEDGTVIHPRTGEVVPGLGVRPGGQPKSLTITVDRTVKDLYADYAAREVEAHLAGEHGTQDGAR